MKGILVINKDGGMTSGAVVSKVRYILGTKKVGHFGTLDPQGTGVLALGIGKATRLFDYFLDKDKEYLAEFEFGKLTDTLDGEGKILETTTVIPTKTQIEKALSKFVGVIDQVPPQFSAKSVNGVRAYSVARKGGAVELKPCKVTVNKFELVKQTKESTYLFKIECSSGTYIRSLCRDLAVSLKSLAIMTSICRTRSGQFLEKNSVTIEELKELKDKAILTLDSVLDDLDRRDFDEALYDKIINGVKIDTEISNSPFKIYCKDELIGIGKEKEGKLKIVTFLKD